MTRNFRHGVYAGLSLLAGCATNPNVCTASISVGDKSVKASADPAHDRFTVTSTKSGRTSVITDNGGIIHDGAPLTTREEIKKMLIVQNMAAFALAVCRDAMEQANAVGYGPKTSAPRSLPARPVPVKPGMEQSNEKISL